MFFRKSVREKINDVISRIRINPDEFLEIPDLNCRIASDKLKYPDGKVVNLDFAESQLLTRELCKDNGIKIRLPTLKEDFNAFQKLNNRYKETHYSEWKAEFLDGSFLMLNPEVRAVNTPRKYEFKGQFISIIETSKYSSIKNNWFGISTDKYDRAAFVSYFDKKRYSAGAIPPLSKDGSGIRPLIDENQ